MCNELKAVNEIEITMGEWCRGWWYMNFFSRGCGGKQLE